MAATLTLRAHGRTVELTGAGTLLELARERLPPNYRPASGRAERNWSVESEDGLERVLSELELWVAEHARRAVFVHAGCVVAGGRAILIPGPSFFGKTTLTAALVRAGALYYSDEYAVIDSRGLVRPYARPLSTRSGAGLATRRVAAGELGGRTGAGPAPVGLIAALRYAPSGWDVKPATSAQAGMVLLQNAVPAQTRPRACLNAIGAACAGALALSGTRGEAEEAAQILLDILESSQRAGEAGISVPELLRAEAARIAARPSAREWLDRTRRRDGSNDLSRLEVISALDEHRGAWPDARS